MERKRLQGTMMVGVIMLIFLAWSAHTRKSKDVGYPSAKVAEFGGTKRPLAVRHDRTKDVFAALADGAELDAASWVAQAEVVIARKQKRRWGERIGSALSRPPNEACALLLAIARAGDPDATKAAHVAIELADECNLLRDLNLSEENFPQAASPPPNSYASSPWWTFTEDVTRRFRAWSRARAESCGRIANAGDVASRLREQFQGDDTPDAQAKVAEVSWQIEREIVARRTIFARDQDETSRRALATALLRSGEDDDIAEAVTMLEGEEDSTGAVDEILEPYHRYGYANHPGDPQLADRELERAAGLGNFGALESMREQFSIAGHPEKALAWELYGLELAQAGCFAFDQPHASWIDGFAQKAFEIEHTLTPVQIDEGIALAAAISAQWSHDAEQALDCGD